MKITLMLLAVLSLLEIALWLPAVWQLRRPLAAALLLAVGLASLVLFVQHPRTWTALVALLGLYRSFNLSRIVKGRMHALYLRQVTRRTSWWLLAEQLLVLALLKLMIGSWISNLTRWQILAGLQAGLTAVLFLAMWQQTRTTREPLAAKAYAERDLPTLTVAVPARNETDELEACLQSLLANDYPKLEIMVLDDCSQNARTPEIIRSFAHDGVQFIPGSEPAATWLAKNWAYEKLYEAANGELVLFCGVDTRFRPDALRQLVISLLAADKAMISLLPRNGHFSPAAALVQPVRYAWELVLPRWLFQRPPVLSTCWLARKELLAGVGGFKAVSRSIVPESYFARQAALSGKYGFFRTEAVSSLKPFAEQRATAVRTRYPQLHRRPEQVALLTAIELFGLFGPFVLLAGALYEGLWWTAAVSGLASLLLMAIYGTISRLAYRRFIGYSPLLMPLAALYDVWLMNYSMLKYEFSDVIWKGRNVCIPVMHVVSSLPKVD